MATGDIFRGVARMLAGAGQEGINVPLQESEQNRGALKTLYGNMLMQSMKPKKIDKVELALIAANGNPQKAMELLRSQNQGLDLNDLFTRFSMPKLVNKLSIANTLKATLQEYNTALENGNSTAAFTIGQRALKTINSPEGADAIGREEAERLGGLLQSVRNPLTYPGLPIGRQYKQFGSSLQDTINILDKSLETQVGQIKEPGKVFDKSFVVPSGGKQGSVNVKGKILKYTIE